jgi:SAM-dependent methyltransferase
MEKSIYLKQIDNESKHWWFKARREILNIQIKKYSTKKKMSILDFGSGSGTNIYMLSKYGEVDVYEKDHKTSNFLKKKFNRNGIKIIKKCFSKKKYDLILAADVIEHIKNDKKIINNLNKILKKNGLIIVTVPAYQFLFSKKDQALKHFRRYNLNGLKKLFNSDFKTLKISYYNSLLFIPIATAIIFFKLINHQFINEVEKKPNNILNYIFYSLFKLEKFILKYFNFPFGISIISVFKKV